MLGGCDPNRGFVLVPVSIEVGMNIYGLKKMFQLVCQMKLRLPRETSLVHSPAGNLAPEPHMHAASVGLIGKICEK